MKLSIAEILEKVKELKTDKEKEEYLLTHKTNSTLLLILKFTYNDAIEFLLPGGTPPWKRNGLHGIEGRLPAEARRLLIFVKGGGYDNLNNLKREQLFIQILESIDDKDADVLINMINKKPFSGITKKLLMRIFPQLF